MHFPAIPADPGWFSGRGGRGRCA